MGVSKHRMLEKQEIEFFLDEIEQHISERDFQLEFFESLQSQFKERGHLSEKQIESLRKMHERVTDIGRLNIRF